MTEGEVCIRLRVDAKMSPFVQIVVFAVLPSETVIAHSNDFATEKCFSHKVRCYFYLHVHEKLSCEELFDLKICHKGILFPRVFSLPLPPQLKYCRKHIGKTKIRLEVWPDATVVVPHVLVAWSFYSLFLSLPSLFVNHLDSKYTLKKQFFVGCPLRKAIFLLASISEL